jgi:cytochrome c biogenesis protein CcmG/thiol:disulfide interchange protein DsbE
MKRFAIIAVLLLSSCSSATKSDPIESFAPCSSILTKGAAADGVFVECLDGPGTLNINAIEGPAVITVWASWCSNCEAQRENFIRLYDESEGRFQVIGVDVEEKSKDEGYRHALASGMKYPHLYDPDGRTSKIFGPGVPITRFIDMNNQVAYQAIGPILKYDELKSLVAEHLGVKI